MTANEWGARRVAVPEINRRSAALLCFGMIVAHIPFSRFERVADMAARGESGGTRALDPGLVQRIKSISNVFEVGGPRADYAYIEDLGDGRGFTITQYGFVTNELEASWIIERYSELVAPNSLTPFLPLLPPQGAGTESAKLRGFPEAWAQEIERGPHLRQACDEIADRLYFEPAMQAAESCGVALPVGRLIFYDTILQHGGGEDPDSLGAITQRTWKSLEPGKPQSEAHFLRVFLNRRLETLLNPANTETTAVWRQSVGRIDALSRLLASNPRLEPPVLVANNDVSAEVS